MYYGTKWNQKHVHPSVIYSHNLSRDSRIKVILVARPLLTLVAQKLCWCEHDVFLTIMRVHYFVSKLFAAVREVFSNTYADSEVPNKTIRRLVTFRDTEIVCLWQALVERQNSWNYGRVDFKQCISCNNGIRMQEFNTAIGFIVLCVKGFMCSTWICILNGTSCSYFFKYT
jgi:hypothetical protein